MLFDAHRHRRALVLEQRGDEPQRRQAPSA